MTPAAPASVDVDPFVQAYEAARAAAGLARVGDHLPPPTDPGYPRVLAELVRVDLEYAWAAGRARRVADYLAEFPGLAADPALLADVAYEEFRQRLERGDRPDPDEYRADYGVDTSAWPAPSVVMADSQPADTGRFPILTPGPLAPDSVADAARAYRLFRSEAGAGSAADLAGDGPATARVLPPEAAGVFRALYASDPAAADRAADAVSAFPEVGGDFLGFRLVDELGRGAFGRVFLARQGELADRFVALKVTADLGGEPQTLAQLQHANIVPVYSVHQAGPMHAVCMPYFGATTLADVVGGLRGDSIPGSGHHIVSTLNNRKSVTRVDSRVANPGGGGEVVGDPLKPGLTHEYLAKLNRYSYVEAVLWLGGRIADGLAHAHARGVVHRDLKPANVLVTDEGQPMLLDFNLAEDKNSAAAAAAARVGGTLPYMAPEHLDAFRGRKVPVDARSDLYSLGLILFEMLAGRPPFPVPTGPIAVVLPQMVEQRRQGPPRLRALNPGVSPAVEAVVLKLLAPDPAARYQSARDLAEDVDRHLADRPLKFAPNPSARERARKWARRNPWATSAGFLTAAAAALVAAAGGAAWARADRIARYEAAEQFDGFRADKRAVEVALGVGSTDRGEIEAGLKDSRRVLGRYGVLDDAGWDTKPAVRNLPEEGRRELRREVGGLLFLTARAAAIRAGDDPDSPGMAEAVRLSELAVSCYAPGDAPAVVRGQPHALRARRPQAAPGDDPGTPRDAHLKAADLAAQGLYKDALPHAKRAAEGLPDQFAAWFVLAACYAGAGKDVQAEGAYDVCVALDPDSYRARLNRGLIRRRLEDYAGARADFTAAAEARPDKADPLLHRAFTLQSSGDPAGAEADVTRALALADVPTRAHFFRAQLRRQLGDRAGAAADLAAGLRLEPADEASWVARGLARKDADPEAALADFRKALDLNPKSRAALQNTAVVLSENLGRPADAAAVLTRAVDLHPDFVPARLGRGVLLARLGRRAEAVADAEASLAASPRTDPSVAYQAGSLYALTAKHHPADKAEALRLLAAAFGKGYGVDLVDKDRDLDPIRDDPKFKDLVAAARKVRAQGRGR